MTPPQTTETDGTATEQPAETERKRSGTTADHEPIGSPPDDGYHVVVVGSGPSGCAASLFCARAGLETLQLENGRSTLNKCAYVENYLGFPLGIEPRQLLDIMHNHVAQTDCVTRETTVESVRRVADGFELHTATGSIRTRTIIAASWSNSDFLADLGVDTQPEGDGPIDEIVTDDSGKTSVDGCYAAGRITGTHHQALVNAGDGARVALHLIKDIVPEFYNDWVAPAGYYERYDRSIPIGVEEISHAERRARAERGRAWLCQFFAEADPTVEEPPLVDSDS